MIVTVNVIHNLILIQNSRLIVFASSCAGIFYLFCPLQSPLLLNVGLMLDLLINLLSLQELSQWMVWFGRVPRLDRQEC